MRKATFTAPRDNDRRLATNRPSAFHVRVQRVRMTEPTAQPRRSHLLQHRQFGE